MKKLFWTLFVLSILTSCTTQKRCMMKFPQTASRDSIFIQKLDTFKLILPGDTIINEVPIKCPDQDILIMENGKLLQKLEIVKGMLKQKLIIKPDTITRYVTNTITKVKEVKVPEKIKFVPKFWKIVGWIGIASILIIAGYFGLKIAKN